MRKYAQPEEVRSAHDLQERMFAALGGSTADPALVDNLKAEYLERYPDQLEGIELLFQIPPFLALSRKLSDPHRRQETDEQIRAEYQDLTETQFLLTHFILGNNPDKQFLSLFWSTLEKMAAQSGYSRELNRIRKGIVTQVATVRVLQEVGMKPTLSHPGVDAFDSIDLWSDASHAVQVKSTGAATAEIVETDEIAFPGARIIRNDKTQIFNSNHFYEMQKFRAKVREYGAKTNDPSLKGFFVVIPYSKVDFATGEPDRELVSMFAQKMGVNTPGKASSSVES